MTKYSSTREHSSIAKNPTLSSYIGAAKPIVVVICIAAEAIAIHLFSKGTHTDAEPTLRMGVPRGSVIEQVLLTIVACF